VVPDEPAPGAGRAGEGARPLDTVVVVGTAGSGEEEVDRLAEAAGRPVVRLLARLDGAAAQPVSWTGPLDDLARADLVLVTGADDPDTARAVFAALGGLTRPGAVLASSSAVVPVVECAVASGRPSDVVGLRVARSGRGGGLAEVASTVVSAPDALATAHALCDSLGVAAVSCPDRAGFVVQALLVPYLNDAARMLEAQYASADDIDAAMTLGCGYPAGPVQVLDELGLDVALAVQRRLYAETREPGLAPAPLLEHLVTAGRLGRRTGRGFREHPAR
jgi:3-hydroxybutyryl-CoA dehydrogenase